MNKEEFENKYGKESCIFDLDTPYHIKQGKINMEYWKRELRELQEYVKLIKIKIKFFEDNYKKLEEMKKK